MHRYWSLTARFFMLLASAGALSAQARFIRLGKPGFASGISADGRIVVGVYGNFGPAFRWTAEEGMVNIGGVGFLARISRDGRTIVSNAKDSSGITSAAIWQGGQNWRTLGGVPGNLPSGDTYSSVYGVSADGSVIVGLAYLKQGNHAFRWDEQNGMVDLGSLHGKGSRANVVSPDGHVTMGWDDDSTQTTGLLYDTWRGAIWWRGVERLVHPYGWIGAAEATNYSGSIVVGQGHPAAPTHAYMYTAWDGRIEDLGALDRGITPDQKAREDRSTAFAVSDDGPVVVGESGYQPPVDAFIWTPVTKMVKLSDYLKANGAMGLDGWWLVGAGAITPDGKTIAGTGRNPEGQMEGWVAVLP